MSLALAVINFLSLLINIYMLIIIFRVILSYFGQIEMGRLSEFLRSATDPVLNIFRRVRFLRAGPFDLSPVAAILALLLVNYLLGSFAKYLTTGEFSILNLFIESILLIWQIIFNLGFLLILVLAIRLISLYLNRGRPSLFWQNFDNFIRPVTRLPARLIKRELSYGHSLLYSVLLFAALLFTVNLIIINLLAGI